jgi:hypothetical protein
MSSLFAMSSTYFRSPFDFSFFRLFISYFRGKSSKKKIERKNEMKSLKRATRLASYKK